MVSFEFFCQFWVLFFEFFLPSSSFQFSLDSLFLRFARALFRRRLQFARVNGVKGKKREKGQITLIQQVRGSENEGEIDGDENDENDDEVDVNLIILAVLIS